MMRKWRKKFQDTDATLALRESRAGYKGGEWSKNWQQEACVWFKGQDLERLSSAFEFVDSKGFRHLMSFALANVSSQDHDQDSELFRAELTAKIALSQAWDADAVRCSDESSLTRDGTSETFKGESMMSLGNHKGMVKILDSVLKVAGEDRRAVVYGIIPSQMKFECGASSNGSPQPASKCTVAVPSGEAVENRAGDGL